MKNQITVSVIQKLMMQTPVLLAHADFINSADALKWVNAKAEEWVKAQEAITAKFHKGEFILDCDRADDSIPYFSDLTGELMLTANKGEEMWMACITEAAIAELMEAAPSTITLNMTGDEANTLMAKLEALMVEVNHGVDVWLAPGGVLDVNNEDGTEVFVDYDSQDTEHLNNITSKLTATLARSVLGI